MFTGVSQGSKIRPKVIMYKFVSQWDRFAGEKRTGRAGQTLVEYVIVAGVLMAAVAVLSVFLYTFREHSGRILDLVSSEYP